MIGAAKADGIYRQGVIDLKVGSQGISRSVSEMVSSSGDYSSSREGCTIVGSDGEVFEMPVISSLIPSHVMSSPSSSTFGTSSASASDSSRPTNDPLVLGDLCYGGRLLEGRHVDLIFEEEYHTEKDPDGDGHGDLEVELMDFHFGKTD